MSTAVFDAYNAFLQLVKTALPNMDAQGGVIDGPGVGWPTNLDFVVVGANDLTADEIIGVDNGQQQWVALGPQRPRDETFTLWAVLVAWVGSTDLSACRARAKTNLAAIETAVRADLTLGGALPNPGWCGMFVNQLKQVQSSSGASLHVPFGLDCRARV